MTYFWAKTTSNDKPGISVYNHMLNVGCVASCIADLMPGLLERFQLQSNVVGALAALHDLGKISPGFQRKCSAWLDENKLSEIDRKYRWDVMEKDHGSVSHAIIQDFLLKIGVSRDPAQYLATVLGAHHGKIKYPPNPRGYRTKPISENNSGIDWSNERLQYADQIWKIFKGENTVCLTDESPAIWWLAGLTSVADWIGSDERFFPPERKEQDENCFELARRGLDAIGFKMPEIVSDLSFHDLFHETPEKRWAPNEMQERTSALISGPGVYVIEAPMGMGKTEAALWAAYNLLLTGKATGIYFALPTQATSNRMHLRMQEFVARIAPEVNASRLIHGNSWLKMDQSDVLNPAASSDDREEGDAKAGRDWFSSAKRALIAPFGVGTIDQALLGVVAAKHFFVRRFALAGKVVILDEVHSYDLYTGTLIDELIKTLEALGCTVIVLSATLTGKRLGEIVSLPSEASDDTRLPYPFITGRHEGLELEPVTAAPPEPLTVKVDFISRTKAAEDAILLARKGGAVLWVCNTVDEAQKQYRDLRELMKKEFPLGLLHARFPFWRREEIEDEWMKLFDKSGKTRCRSILVSTQIVEQSVDLDADLLITELAPTDMLLQRLGRLWRHHEREHRPADNARICIIEEEKSLDEFRIMESKKIRDTLGGKAHVYDPFVLLRTLQLWKGYPEITIPTQIRELIEETYRYREDEQESWCKLYEDAYGKALAHRQKALMSSNIWNVALEDEEGVQTRLNEIETVAVVLCRSISKKEAVFVNDTSAVLGSDKFLLPTAQAIHRNLVKVPKNRCFERDRIVACSSFEDYLHGVQTVGIVSDDGAVDVHGLKSGIKLFYSNEKGLVIEGKSGKEGV